MTRVQKLKRKKKKEIKLKRIHTESKIDNGVITVEGEYSGDFDATWLVIRTSN